MKKNSLHSNFTKRVLLENRKYIDFAINKGFPKILRGNYSLLVITVLVVVSNLFFFSEGTVSSNIPTYSVKRDLFLVSITESGEIKAKKSISITAPRIRGALKIVELVPEGDYIKSGDVVAKFDPTEAIARLTEAESELEKTLSNKDKLMANHASKTAQLRSDLKSSELSFELSNLNM